MAAELDTQIHFSGVIPALVTPFAENGNLDLAAYIRLIHRVLKGGVSGVVVGGSTGEGATLKEEELAQLVAVAQREVAGRVPIIVGAASNDTAQAVDKVAAVTRMGADALLVVTPYYNKPPQEGLVQHFCAVAAATELPIIVYNVPGRTGCNLLPATVERLLVCENIVAIKDASGSMDQAAELVQRCKGKLALLSGEDSLWLPHLRLGFDGIISVIGNLLPAAMISVEKAHRQGLARRAEELFNLLQPIIDALFLESNPIPLKAALARAGVLQNRLRLPLVPMSQEAAARLQQVLDNTLPQLEGVTATR